MQYTVNNSGRVVDGNGKPLSNKELAELFKGHRLASAGDRAKELATKKRAELRRAKATLTRTQKRIKRLEQQLAAYEAVKA